MPDSLSLVWGHSGHCAIKFPLLRFSKGFCSHSFHSISAKLYCKYAGHEGIQAVTVFGDLPKFKNFLCNLEIFVNTDHMGLEITALLLLQFSSDLGQTL